MKIGIFASKYYTKKNDVKKFLLQVKEKVGNTEEIEITIINRKTLIDSQIKKLVHFVDYKYSEFIPYYEKWNPFCVEKAYLFNKQYSHRYFFTIFSKFVKYCDLILILDSEEKSDSMINYILKILSKKNKDFIVLKS